MRRLCSLLMLLAIACAAPPAAAQGATEAGPQAGTEQAGTTPAPVPLSPIEKRKRRANAVIVTLMTPPQSGTGARFAEDIGHSVNDPRPGGVRVLPVAGNGGVQNLEDLLLLTGIDMAIVGQEHLGELKARDPALYGGIGGVVRYVAKLHDSEVHILARAPYERLVDLHGRRISLNLKNSHAHAAAERLFRMAGVEAETSFMDDHDALLALREGRLDAHVIVSGAPHPALAALKEADGLALIPVTEDDMPPENRDELFGLYPPGVLLHEHYPGLIAKDAAVPTLSSGTLLAVYKWPKGSFRYRRIERFVKAFFDQAESLRHPSRHPKWRDFNPAAEVPGWVRFDAAQNWLEARKQESPPPDPAVTGSSEKSMRRQFEAFLARREDASGGAAISEPEKEKLFDEFRSFIAFHGGPGND